MVGPLPARDLGVWVTGPFVSQSPAGNGVHLISTRLAFACALHSFAHTHPLSVPRVPSPVSRPPLPHPSSTQFPGGAAAPRQVDAGPVEVQEPRWPRDHHLRQRRAGGGAVRDVFHGKGVRQHHHGHRGARGFRGEPQRITRRHHSPELGGRDCEKARRVPEAPGGGAVGAVGPGEWYDAAGKQNGRQEPPITG